MKIKDLDFSNYTNGDIISRSLLPEYDENKRKALYRLIHKAEDTEQFIDLYLANDEFKNSQAFVVISRECRFEQHWYRIRACLGDRVKKTMSDAGGLKVGNGDFSVIIPNGYGDGITRYAIVESGSWNRQFLRFFTSVQGTINIYSYDCGGEVVETITGRYGVYHGEGFVVFENWSK